MLGGLFLSYKAETLLLIILLDLIMHLIVFPFFIYTGLGMLILLFWPQRGINGKNYLLMVSAAMGGLLVGFCIAIVVRNFFNPVLHIYLMLVFLPSVSALLAVSFLGSEGFNLASKESVLYRFPHSVCYSGLIALFSATLVSLPVAYLWVGGKYYEGQILLGALIVGTLGAICSFVLSGFVKQPSLGLAFKVSLKSGLTALLISLVLGPYFTIALPVIVFVIVATFLFVFALYKFNENLTKNLV